jgi:hypothetical protein
MDLMTRIEFGQDHVENDLALMAPDAIDRLAFGAIQLNAAGLVLGYNETDSTITGRRKEAVIGRNLFNGASNARSGDVSVTPAARALSMVHGSGRDYHSSLPPSAGQRHSNRSG